MNNTALFLLQDGTCTSSCPASTYIANVNGNRHCLPCHTTCSSCADDPAADKCTACVANLFRSSDTTNFSCLTVCPSDHYSINGTCFPCHTSCSSCAGAGETRCTSCPAGKLKSQNGSEFECIASCPEFFYNSNNTVCLPCSTNCGACSGSNANECTSCKATFLKT